jgi:hypothetical protein
MRGTFPFAGEIEAALALRDALEKQPALGI